MSELQKREDIRLVTAENIQMFLARINSTAYKDTDILGVIAEIQDWLCAPPGADISPLCSRLIRFL
jgi:hypothetical protein